MRLVLSFVSENNSFFSLYITILSLETPDSVSVSPQSHSGPMVEGTEYQLQCDIQNVAPLRSLVVRWYKGNEPVKTETFHNSTRIPVDVFSTLNITPRRFEDEVKYRCEAELDLGPKGPLASVLSSQTLHFAVYCKSFCFLFGVGGPAGLFNVGPGVPRHFWFSSSPSNKGLIQTWDNLQVSATR